MKYFKVKGQLVETEERKVPDVLKPYCLSLYENQYYALVLKDDGWYFIAKRGCAVDWATKFPDFWWIQWGSVWHDIGHWLIDVGAIHTKANNVIDHILGEDVYRVSMKGNYYDRFMAKRRRCYIEKATNLVNQKVGEGRELYEVITA